MNILFLLKPKCNVAYLNQSDTIRQGLEKMRHHGYTAIPVIDDNGIYVGTITEGDFLWNILPAKTASTNRNFHVTVFGTIWHC